MIQPKDPKTAVSFSVSIVILTAAVLLIGTTASVGRHTAVVRQAIPIITLRTSEGPIETGGPASALVRSQNDDDMVYIVNGLTGEVGAYQGGPDPSYRPFAYTVGPLAVRS